MKKIKKDPTVVAIRHPEPRLCWLVNTFIADQSSFITDNMSVLTNEHPWIYIIAVFIVGAITTSQSSSTMIMVPIGIALGLPANIIVAGWIACSSNYFIPASGQCVAAIAFDTAGTTKIGKEKLLFLLLSSTVNNTCCLANYLDSACHSAAPPYISFNSMEETAADSVFVSLRYLSRLSYSSFTDINASSF